MAQRPAAFSERHGARHERHVGRHECPVALHVRQASCPSYIQTGKCRFENVVTSYSTRTGHCDSEKHLIPDSALQVYSGNNWRCLHT